MTSTLHGISATLGRTSKARGFTLVELMVAVAIIGILAAIAYPSYTHYVTKSRRADGQGIMLDVAAREERFFIDNNTYTTVIKAPGGCADAACGLGLSSDMSQEGYYKITVETADAAGFSLKATPQGAQSNDTECANLTYSSIGMKGASGSASDPAHDCW